MTPPDTTEAETPPTPTATAVNELDRYLRQIKIWGEDGQKKISNAKVVIVGSGNCAKYTAMPLTALGFGEVRILGTGTEEGMLMDIPFNEERVMGYEMALKKLNPQVRVLGLPIDLESRLGQDLLTDTQVIIDTTNSTCSKALVIDYAQKHDIPVLTSGVASSYAKLMLLRPGQEVETAHMMPNFEGQEQSPLISLLWGGVIAEEAKKLVLGDKNVLESDLYYKQGFADRFTFLKDNEKLKKFSPKPYQKRSVLAIGSGALGNIMAIALAEMGFGRVDYLDYDTIESTNLNRQVLFYDSVGLDKASVLADKHKTMNPLSQTRGLVTKFDIQEGKWSIDEVGQEYDLVLDLVDNIYARALLSAYSVTRGIPLISAASSPEAARIVTYVPGKSSCMDHVFSGYYDRGQADEIQRRHSCIQEPDPSVIVTNQVGAALAALEACTVFQPRKYGKPFNGSLKYSTNLDMRLGMTPLRDVCDCHKHTDRVPDMEIRE